MQDEGKTLDAVRLRFEISIYLHVPPHLNHDGSHSLILAVVTEPLVEQRRKNELLVAARIDRPARKHGRVLEVGFKLLLGDVGHE